MRPPAHHAAPRTPAQAPAPRPPLLERHHRRGSLHGWPYWAIDCGPLVSQAQAAGAQDAITRYAGLPGRPAPWFGGAELLQDRCGSWGVRVWLNTGCRCPIPQIPSLLFGVPIAVEMNGGPIVAQAVGGATTTDMPLAKAADGFFYFTAGHVYRFEVPITGTPGWQSVAMALRAAGWGDDLTMFGVDSRAADWPAPPLAAPPGAFWYFCQATWNGPSDHYVPNAYAGSSDYDPPGVAVIVRAWDHSSAVAPGPDPTPGPGPQPPGPNPGPPAPPKPPVASNAAPAAAVGIAAILLLLAARR